MRVAAAFCAIILVLWAALVPTDPSPRADVRILEYDKNGRPTNVRRFNAENGEKAPGADVLVLPENRYEDGELLVVNPPPRFQGPARRLGFAVIETVQLPQLSLEVFRLRTPDGLSVPQAITLLRRRFPGSVIDANHIYQPQQFIYPSRGQPQQQARYSASDARGLIGWAKATADCGKGVRLGMIDAPVDVRHPALAGQHIRFRSFHKARRKPGPADHGTAIAAMLVGKPSWGGLLPGAELRAGNIFEVNETGQVVGNAVGLLKAINWLAKERVHVINLSVAGADNKVMRIAFKRAQKKNLVMVAAAGNWGSADRPAYPAAYKQVVAVTAFGRQWVVYFKANRGPYIDFAAPGVRVWTAVPGGGRFQSGTSFAVPYITVLMALEIVRRPGRSSSTLRRFLSKHTIDLGVPGRDDIFGWGFVDLRPDCAG